MTLQVLVVASMLALGIGGLASLPIEAAPSIDLRSPIEASPVAESTAESSTYRITVSPTIYAAGALEFKVPEGAYSKVVVIQRDHTKYSYVGQYETHIHAPSEATKPFMDGKGGGYTTPAGGNAYVGSGLGVSTILPYEPGAWRLSYVVEGALDLAFDIRVS